ncbi:MAG TPA: chloride channel protein [Actinomycetota bacterium]|nr:chloride channel protein [Actinomycetota bacterium]
MNDQPPLDDPNRLPEDDVVGVDQREQHGVERELGDFTTPWRTVRLVPLAVVIGALSAIVALVLLDLIGAITNLAYYHRWSLTLISPAANRLGAVAIVIPVVGSLIVGLMARYGSERIRGHGIPEAMETILVGGSKVEPRLTALKPVSSAISIGTGGPFGAEGPIILTGGALGSVIAQFFHLSAIERRCLLVAGAAGGMSAVFGTPVAAVILGVELLVFEWKPRSLVLIALASAVADVVRIGFAHAGLLHPEPLFPLSAAAPHGAAILWGSVVLGLAGGASAWLLTKAVYGAEDAFKRLPIHWMWWPAIGGLVVGIGGLIEPRALGVGYDTIGAELAGKLAIATLLSVFLVKLLIWAVALGSGTSGGILAPILIMGAAVGGLLSPILPGASVGTWSLLGMAGALAGVTRSPLTAVVFALELTRDPNTLLPLLLVSIIAHLLSVLVLKRSILTEKVARRGFHVLREYSVGPMEVLFVRDVMATDILTVESGSPFKSIYATVLDRSAMRGQRLLPVLSSSEVLIGVVPWMDILERAARGDTSGTVDDVMHTDVVVAYPDEALRTVADRMAQRRLGVLPVVTRDRPDRLRGIITQFDLLRARERNLEEERHRERVLRLRVLPRMPRPLPRRGSRRGNRPEPERPGDAAVEQAEGTAGQSNNLADELPLDVE